MFLGKGPFFPLLPVCPFSPHPVFSNLSPPPSPLFWVFPAASRHTPYCSLWREDSFFSTFVPCFMLTGWTFSTSFSLPLLWCTFARRLCCLPNIYVGPYVLLSPFTHSPTKVRSPPPYTQAPPISPETPFPFTSPLSTPPDIFLFFLWIVSSFFYASRRFLYLHFLKTPFFAPFGSYTVLFQSVFPPPSPCSLSPSFSTQFFLLFFSLLL